MLIDVRPASRLRGPHAVDPTGPLTGAIEAVRRSDLDLSRVRIVADWIQYRNNFREPVDVRSIAAGTPEEEIEIALDLRRTTTLDVAAATTALLAGEPDRVWLDDWAPGSAGCVWQFNRLFWQYLQLWEKATGRAYESTLPGGASDSTNTASIRELIGELVRSWDDLAARRSLPDELYVVELGVGNGNQARAWLDELRASDAETGKGYYRRLHYLMCDYSPHVLELARATVADHAERVSCLVLDATTPTTALGFLRYKVFLVYVSNVYDNLPCDEVVNLGGQPYRVDTRTYLSAESAAEIAQHVGVQVEELPAIVAKLLQLGPEVLAEALPERFAGIDATVEFWRRSWDGLRRAERFVPMPGLDSYQITPSLSGEMLRPLLDDFGDVRINVSNGAVASFADTLPLLHPYGRLVSHDLFITDVAQARTGFRGPGKYDGSVVNWVNGPLLAHIGSRKGMDVRFAPFAHRSGTHIVTMTAQVRD